MSLTHPPAGARRLIRPGRGELQFLPGRSDEKTAKLRLPRPQGGGGGERRARRPPSATGRTGSGRAYGTARCRHWPPRRRRRRKSAPAWSAAGSAPPSASRRAAGPPSRPAPIAPSRVSAGRAGQQRAPRRRPAPPAPAPSVSPSSGAAAISGRAVSAQWAAHLTSTTSSSGVEAHGEQIERAVVGVGLEQPVEPKQASKAAPRSTGWPARCAREG